MENIRTQGRTRLPIGTSLLLTLALAFFMLFSVCTEVVLYRYMTVLVFVLLLLIAVRSRLVLLLAALPCLLALMGAGTSAALPLLLCLIAVVGFGGFAIGAVNPLILSAAPVLSYLLALLLTKNAVESLSVLMFVPLAAVAALALRLKLSRTASIVAVATSLFVYIVIALVLSLPEGLSLSREAFSEFIVSFRELLTDEIMSMAEMEELAATVGTIDRGAVSSLINASLRLLPAAAIVTLEIIAYLACLICISLRSEQLPDKPLPEKCLVFRMSSVSAVLFIISFLVALLPESRSDTIGVLLLSATNLFVVLQPGLAVCGVLRTVAQLRQRRFLSPIFLIVLLIWFSSFIPVVLAFVGAFAVIRAERAARPDKK